MGNNRNRQIRQRALRHSGVIALIAMTILGGRIVGIKQFRKKLGIISSKTEHNRTGGAEALGRRPGWSGRARSGFLAGGAPGWSELELALDVEKLIRIIVGVPVVVGNRSEKLYFLLGICSRIGHKGLEFLNRKVAGTEK